MAQGFVPTADNVIGGGTEATAQRVTVANDSTGVLSVDDNSGSLTVDGTVTVTQATATNLNAAVVGTGTAGTPAGNILTVQGVASMTKLLVTPDSVALPANQSVNVAQINGVTPLMGNGVTGTGSHRTTIASDNTPFQVAASNETATIYQGTTARTPVDVFANIAASQTDSSLVAADGSLKIRVLQVAAVCGTSATNLTFNSKPAGAGAAISCLFANAANGGIVLPFSPNGWFTTVAAEGLTVTTGAGSTTGIQIKYVLVS